MAALIFLTVSRIHQYYGFLAVLQPALLLFGGAVVYAVVNPSSIKLDNLWTTGPPKVVWALAILACISVPFALSMGAAGSYFLNTYSKVLLVFFLTVASIRHHRDLYLFVWTYVLACAFIVYQTVFNFQLEQAGNMLRLGNLFMYDANGLGVILTVGIPICVVAFRNSGRWGRPASLVILLGIGASLARSGSRGGFLGLMAVGLALLFLLKRVSIAKRIGTVGAVAAGLFMMAPPGYWQQMQTLTEPTQDYNWESPYGRKAIAERGVEYMLSHPFTGVGFGNFGRAEWKLSDIARQRQQTGQGFKLTAAHNSFLQVGAELGIPGLLAFCLLVFGSPYGLVQLQKKLPGGWRERGPPEAFVVDLARFLPVGWLGFAVTGFFVSWAYLDLVYFLAALTTGIYVSVHRLLAAGQGQERPCRIRASAAPRADKARARL